MTSLEDTVRLVVQDFMTNNVLFTALDVSNVVKQSLPHERHRSIRDVVRALFLSDIQPQNWERTPITVTLSDGSTTDALLYYPLSDSWDLDNKYDAQQRSKVTSSSSLTMTTSVSVPVVTVPTVPTVSAPVVPFATARSLWESMFSTQPSLFPTK
jgi:hypothetical protein